TVTGVQTCALPIYARRERRRQASPAEDELIPIRPPERVRIERERAPPGVGDGHVLRAAGGVDRLVIDEPRGADREVGGAREEFTGFEGFDLERHILSPCRRN